MKQNKHQKRIVLLDAHAIIHRAYHALPDFTGPEGQPTGALYGLTSMLMRIITDLKPDYIAACYDLPKPTVRHEAYENYKGTRSKTDDALKTQLQSSRDVFEAFSIPIYEREGFEADDLLGTIVEMTKDMPELEVVIASGDMDTLQLVEGERVKVYTLKKGINDTILYSEKDVKERFGFDPELIPDFKGLRGDPSDNIIGVPGIGEKTATELIVNFGSLEKLFKTLHKDENLLLEKGIKPRIVNLLKEHEEDALFSKMIATIRLDAPIAFRVPETTYLEHVRADTVVALCDTLGFRSLRPRVRQVLGGVEVDEEQLDAEPDVVEDISKERMSEAQAMLWLLSSEFTNPKLEDIMAYTKAKTFSEAHDTLYKSITSTGSLKRVYEEIEAPLIPVVLKMEQHGVLVDTKTLEGLKEKYRAELEGVEKTIYRAAGHEFNISSPKQLGTVLFEELGLMAKGQKKTAGGQLSTRESELEKIRDLHPVIEAILEYRQIQKLLSTYIESMPPLLDEHSRLHADFLATGTTTGRMASQNPNLQNIPIRTERGRAIRHAFVAPKGYTLLGLDYSQVELRIAAILSGDEKLKEIFMSGRDVHQEVAAAVFNVPSDAVDREMRRRAKIINFGILYGMGVNALKTQLGTTTAEAHAFYDDYFRTFNTLAEYLETTKGFARKHGYTETLYGRQRQFPEMKSSLPYVRAQAERMAINAPIQGTQADIIKKAMVAIDAYLEEKNLAEEVHLILQVHDELVFEVNDRILAVVAHEIQRCMETVLTEEESNGVPIRAEAKIGKDWGSMESYV
ncbi:MAG: hypothetical protein KBC16_00975 [Candidatus Pacebacteria bacterium]|nr:hypothetical protein [Candidatus Paceibacterota bacterium]